MVLRNPSDILNADMLNNLDAIKVMQQGYEKANRELEDSKMNKSKEEIEQARARVDEAKAKLEKAKNDYTNAMAKLEEIHGPAGSYKE